MFYIILFYIIFDILYYIILYVSYPILHQYCITTSMTRTVNTPIPLYFPV